MPRKIGSKNKVKVSKVEKVDINSDPSPKVVKRGRPKKLDKDTFQDQFYVTPQELAQAALSQEKYNEEEEEGFSLKKGSPKSRAAFELNLIGWQSAVDCYRVLVKHAVENEDIDACQYILDRTNGGPLRGNRFPYKLPNMDSVQNVLLAQQKVFDLLAKGLIVDSQAIVVFKLMESVLLTLRELQEDRYAEFKAALEEIKQGVQNLHESA